MTPTHLKKVAFTFAGVCASLTAADVFAQTDITGQGGVTSAQYTDSPTGEAYSNLTDDNVNSKYLTFHSLGWIQFEANTPAVVTGYTMTSANDAPERDPLDWNLQGSNDGYTWTALDTRSGEDFSSRFQTRSFEIDNTQSFKIYRFNMNNNSSNIMQLAEFELFAAGGDASDSDSSDAELGDIVPLYNSETEKEPDSQWYDDSGNLITRFSDRPRTRHAREDQFQSYDHYIKLYFENRSTNVEIIDTIPAGGNSITMNVRTLWPLDDTEAENRWWYLGRNTVAHYVGNGTMEYLGTSVENGVAYFNYTKTDTVNRQYDRAIEMGDQLEFEISQFNAATRFGEALTGQQNYYGTTYLYIVGKGLVPWYTENTGEFVEGAADFQEDSREIPEDYWLGGLHSTLHYQYTDEPDNHFMQMATYLGYGNGQTFLEGRRVHHSSTIDGTHDEDAANGVFDGMPGLTGPRYINERCTGCHHRNGAAPVVANGELLDRWVFKVGDANGDAHPDYGRVLQPKGSSGEGDVSIASWTESDGLRSPNYQFTGTPPETFSARIAPRLVGLGLIDAIPESTIIGMADPNDADGDGISGRVNKILDPETGDVRLGRFGWKAATSSVRHQVASAYNTDMGVKSSIMPNLDCGSNQSGCDSGAALIADDKIDKIVTYLSTLGVRPQRGIKEGQGRDSTVDAGKQTFLDIGCAGCHTETLDTSANHPMAENRNQTIHPYSDFLLHDMGTGLADNLGEGEASGSEWRTTPLWGLGLSACVTGGVTNPTGNEGDEICTPHHAYLHDGRARTIEEAILWHGGEGQASNSAYQGLSDSDKQAVLRFLESL